MDDRRARRLSWLTTILCSLYVEWMAYHLGTLTGTFATLFQGIGGTLPSSTAFVVGLSPGILLAAGTLIVAGLVAKEFFIKEAGVRHVVTFVTFMCVGWFFYWCLMAIYKPMIDIMHKIG
jgi:hypothetical protein